MPLSQNDLLEAIATGMAPVLKEFVEMHTAPLRKRIEALEAAAESLGSRVKGVEEKGIQYRGTWSEDEHYGRGDAVTSGGHMWVAKRANLVSNQESPMTGQHARGNSLSRKAATAATARIFADV